MTKDPSPSSNEGGACVVVNVVVDIEDDDGATVVVVDELVTSAHDDNVRDIVDEADAGEREDANVSNTEGDVTSGRATRGERSADRGIT